MGITFWMSRLFSAQGAIVSNAEIATYYSKGLNAHQ
jgi:hypothetical protein